MFTQHEKGAYFALKNLVEPMGYIVFAKVRLWDLVEPRNANDLKSRGKIQAKHCDFVLVDKKLVARAVVELDDSTHDKPDRQMRDQFVDGVLTSCGYKVFHTRNIKDREFQEELKKSLSGNAANINERG
jgi:very-short-patch-repair endonuclease